MPEPTTARHAAAPDPVYPVAQLDDPDPRVSACSKRTRRSLPQYMTWEAHSFRQLQADVAVERPCPGAVDGGANRPSVGLGSTKAVGRGGGPGENVEVEVVRGRFAEGDAVVLGPHLGVAPASILKREGGPAFTALMERVKVTGRQDAPSASVQADQVSAP